MSPAITSIPKPDSFLNGRPVYFGDVHLAGVDSYFESATWADTDEALTDSELEALGENEADYLVTENLERFGYYQK